MTILYPMIKPNISSILIFHFILDLMPLPVFSEITCPFAYKSYSVCILVSYTKEEFRDLMLLKTIDSATTVLKGFLRDEPRVKAVVVLADEDSPNFHTV